MTFNYYKGLVLDVGVLDSSPSKNRGGRGEYDRASCCSSIYLTYSTVTMLGKVAMSSAPHAELCSTHVLQFPRALRGS